MLLDTDIKKSSQIEDSFLNGAEGHCAEQKILNVSFSERGEPLQLETAVVRVRQGTKKELSNRGLFFKWCRRPDSNRHVVTHTRF